MVGLNFKEHTDGFNRDNIPGTILDKAFHIESGPIPGGPANGQVHNFDAPVLISVFLKGFRNIVTAIDNSMTTADTILADILDQANRLTASGIKNIEPIRIEVVQLNDANDKDIILELEFNTKIIVCL